MIVCVLIPAFLTALERQLNPTLVGRPLLIRAVDSRSYVYAMCAEAARQGIVPGMPIRQAQALLPEAVVLPADPGRYRDALDGLAESLLLFSDKVEVAGLPQFGKAWRRRSGLHVQTVQFHAVAYLDLGKLNADEALDLGRQLQRHIQTYQRMQAAVGLSAGKFTAYAAARLTKAGDVQLVRAGNEAGFLARRPVGLLPLETEIARRLHLFGIETLGAFAALPRAAVLAQFGKPGRELHRLACGEDARPVLARPPRREERLRLPFDDPVTDEPILAAAITHLTQVLAERLNHAALVARGLRLLLQTDDGAGHEVERRLRRPNADAAHLTTALLRLFERLALRQAITEIRLTAFDLVQIEHQQLELFPAERDESVSAQVLEDLVARFGAGCFYRASVVDAAAHLPEQRFELDAVDAA